MKEQSVNEFSFPLAEKIQQPTYESLDSERSNKDNQSSPRLSTILRQCQLRLIEGSRERNILASNHSHRNLRQKHLTGLSLNKATRQSQDTLPTRKHKEDQN